VAKRSKQLTHICSKYGLNDVTTFDFHPAVHWEFATGTPLQQYADLSCSWTAVGALHYFRLTGRDVSDLESSVGEIANTVLFDATEIQDIRRIGSPVEFRNVADDVLGFTRGQRAAALLRLIELGLLCSEDSG
jgi:hypothetical protein